MTAQTKDFGGIEIEVVQGRDVGCEITDAELERLEQAQIDALERAFPGAQIEVHTVDGSRSTAVDVTHEDPDDTSAELPDEADVTAVLDEVWEAGSFWRAAETPLAAECALSSYRRTDAFGVTLLVDDESRSGISGETRTALTRQRDEPGPTPNAEWRPHAVGDRQMTLGPTRQLDVTHWQGATPLRSGSLINDGEQIGVAHVTLTGEMLISLDDLPDNGQLRVVDAAHGDLLDSALELYGRLPRTPSNSSMLRRASDRFAALGVSIAPDALASDRKAEQLGVDRAIVALREAREALVRAADRLDREGVGSFEQDECSCAVETIDNALAAMGVRS